MIHKSLSLQTRMNWLIDAVPLGGGVLAAITGIYFLFLPSGGYRGGRNPYYGITVLFDRHTWDAWHTWTGILMIAAVVIHFAIHWKWVKMMIARTIQTMLSHNSQMSRGTRINVAVDATIASSFVVAAVSGLYFFFFPASTRTTLLFNSTTWDLIHTWSGVVLIVAALVHLAIHWRWIVNVTSRFFLSGLPNQAKLVTASNLKSQA